jgi:sigma-B regulation protein RsbU (phosphoserine phosphatase)
MTEAGGGRLLVVDDNQVNRMLLGRHLELQGHSVCYAENGRQALEKLRAEPFEMMLLDIEMPEMNGYQVLEQVTADPRLRDLPVLVTSALEEIDSVVRCIQMGAEDYLIKPVNEVLLKARIDASLEKKRLRDRQRQLLSQLERELEIARQTQQSILPEALPEHPGYDFGALMAPASAVGGDFYEFIDLPDGRLGIVIGDVSDKGLPAALFMALTYSLVRAEAARADSPRQVLRAVNRHLLEMNASGMFVTLIYAVLDFKSGALNYGRAGHPLPLGLGTDGRTLTLAMQPGQPLGLFEDPAIDEQCLVLPPGGLVLMYSDGLTEAADLQGQQFGLARLQQRLSGGRAAMAQELCQQLWLAVQAHSNELPHQDDFTAVIIKRTE